MLSDQTIVFQKDHLNFGAHVIFGISDMVAIRATSSRGMSYLEKNKMKIVVSYNSQVQ